MSITTNDNDPAALRAFQEKLRAMSDVQYAAYADVQRQSGRSPADLLAEIRLAERSQFGTRNAKDDADKAVNYALWDLSDADLSAEVDRQLAGCQDEVKMVALLEHIHYWLEIAMTHCDQCAGGPEPLSNDAWRDYLFYHWSDQRLTERLERLRTTAG